MIVLIQRKDNLMIEFITVSTLERSIKSIYIIVIILLIRRKLNINSTNKANKILWSILFIYLIFPYSILIEIENQSEYIVLQIISEFILVIQEYIRLFTKQFGQVLSAVNRLIVSILFLTYIITQIIIRNKAMKTSILIENNERINKCVSLFRFKRKIKILVNDKIKVPVTYGVIRPKIILQSHILYDDELLKHVLIHELVHIQKFDIIFSHIKNLITCAYWYNLFIILASKYIEDDIEILCDKLVVQQIGDSVITRKNYCLSLYFHQSLVQYLITHLQFSFVCLCLVKALSSEQVQMKMLFVEMCPNEFLPSAVIQQSHSWILPKQKGIQAILYRYVARP